MDQLESTGWGGTVWRMDHYPRNPSRSRVGNPIRTRFVGAVLAGLVIVSLGACSSGDQRGRSAEAKQLSLRVCGAVFEAVRQLECYQKHFRSVRETEGLEAALNQVVAWHESPEGAGFATYCHEVLHNLGETEMREAGNKKSRIMVFSKSKVTCTGGFVHGALTEYYKKMGGARVVEGYRTLCPDLVSEVSKVAGKDLDKTGWLTWNCDHMLGHELYKASAKDLVAGAALCGWFERESDQRYGCEAGFYMEHYLVMGRTLGEGYAKAEDISEVHSLCRAVDDEVARGCWSESGGMVYSKSGWDWAKAGDACRIYAPNASLLESCYEGLGRNIPPYAGYEAGQMKAWCREIGEDRATEICALQIARAVAMELDEVEIAEGICRELIKDETLLNRCVRGAAEIGEQLDGSGFGGGIGTWGR